MKAHQGRRTALIAALLGVAMLVASSLACRRPLLERWYAWRFDVGAEEEKIEAAVKLGELGSDRAVPWLLETLLAAHEQEMQEVARRPGGLALCSVESLFNDRARRLRDALVRLGKPSLPALLRGLATRDINTTLVCHSTLARLEPELTSGGDLEQTLGRLASDETRPAAVRKAAAEALAARVSRR